MFLAENGIYYLDKEMKNEFTNDLFDEIKDELMKDIDNSHKKYINKKEFIFHYYFGHLCIIDEAQNKIELSYNPIDIDFKIKEKKERRRISSLDQYKKAVKFFKFEFPWSQTIFLSNENLFQLIYSSDSQKNIIEIEDLDAFNIDLTKEKKDINKFADLSNFISYYIKSEINLNKYPEKIF